MKLRLAITELLIFVSYINLFDYLQELSKFQLVISLAYWIFIGIRSFLCL